MRIGSSRCSPCGWSLSSDGTYRAAAGASGEAWKPNDGDIGRTSESDAHEDHRFARCARTLVVRTVVRPAAASFGGVMSDHPNVKTVNSMTEAIFSQDHDALAKIFADDLVFHLRGPDPMAGDHAGVGGLLGVIG